MSGNERWGNSLLSIGRAFANKVIDFAHVKDSEGKQKLTHHLSIDVWVKFESMGDINQYNIY